MTQCTITCTDAHEHGVGMVVEPENVMRATTPHCTSESRRALQLLYILPETNCNTHHTIAHTDEHGTGPAVEGWAHGYFSFHIFLGHHLSKHQQVMQCTVVVSFTFSKNRNATPPGANTSFRHATHPRMHQRARHRPGC